MTTANCQDMGPDARTFSRVSDKGTSKSYKCLRTLCAGYGMAHSVLGKVQATEMSFVVEQHLGGIDPIMHDELRPGE